MQPRLITHCSALDRDIYFLSVSRPDSFPGRISVPSQTFSVFLAIAPTGLDHTIISSIALTLLRAGAVYFCCYGPDSERVHDIIDEQIVQSAIEEDGSVIMTTWHSEETLQDALWFFVTNSFPDDKYLNTCRAGVAISCGNSSWDGQIIVGLKDQTKSKTSPD